MREERFRIRAPNIFWLEIQGVLKNLHRVRIQDFVVDYAPPKV